MTSSEKRRALVQKVKSREGKNKYTQSEKRSQVANGYSDCSSLQRWAYREVLGIDIGINTEAQIKTPKLITVDVEIVDGIPNENKMLPGDLLYFRGRDTSRNDSKYVGHVEMYVGNGQLSGHGSGTGPTRKNMVSYCKQRQTSSSPVPAGNRGLICIRRAALEDAAASAGSAKAETTPTSEGGLDFMRDLVKGDKGYGEIATLQRLLKAMNYYKGEVDKSFGPKTEAAVKDFQKVKGIEVKYPGTVGPKTWRVLLTEC